MDKKYQHSEYFDRLTPEIDKMMKGLNLGNEMCISINYQTQDNMLSIPKPYIKVMQGRFSDLIRTMPIIMKYKIGLMRRAIKNFINDVVFQERFQELVDKFEFGPRVIKLDGYVQDVE
jgi:hypothetical protein